METTQLSPAENDMALAEILRQREAKFAEVSRLNHYLESPYTTPDMKLTYQVEREEALAEISNLNNDAAPYEAHYQNNLWQRYYLVTNGNGHVHIKTYCNTCFPTTEFAWLPDCSGMTEAELVEEFGERVCTICCPSAPVIKGMVGRRDRVAADEKAAEKAAKFAAKLEKAILPTGEALKLEGWATHPKTLIAAQRTLSSEMESLLWYGNTHPSANEWIANIEILLTAISAKTGEDREELRAKVTAKVTKKVAKERS